MGKTGLHTGRAERLTTDKIKLRNMEDCLEVWLCLFVL